LPSCWGRSSKRGTDASGIVLAGAGPVFSAGHDFGDVTARDLAGTRDLVRLCTDLMRTIQSVPQVVIARVHGLATAAGCQLIASCDLAVAARSAGFALAGGKGGWFCHTPAVPVARAVGRGGAEDADPAVGVLDDGENVLALPGQGDGLDEVAGEQRLVVDRDNPQETPTGVTVTSSEAPLLSSHQMRSNDLEASLQYKGLAFGGRGAAGRGGAGTSVRGVTARPGRRAGGSGCAGAGGQWRRDGQLTSMGCLSAAPSPRRSTGQ
jgi:hypothetical protein